MQRTRKGVPGESVPTRARNGHTWSVIGNLPDFSSTSFLNNAILPIRLTMRKLKISLILPAYNDEKRLPQTLDEITSFLEQRFDDYEVIAIDDGSHDRTLEVLATYRDENSKIKILRNKRNKGKGYSIKKGIYHAKFPLLVFFLFFLPTLEIQTVHAIPSFQAK